MTGSQNRKNIILEIYQNSRTVFRLNDIALLVGESSFQSLNKKLNYYVRMGKLLNPRKGIYAKPNYRFEEMACSIYAPAYISLEYVLQKAGVLFQYDSKITMVSYLSRELEIDGQSYLFRKIKENILLNPAGVIGEDNLNTAIPERAFLDLLYLEKNYYFDNLNPLDKGKINQLLPLYRSKALGERLKKILQK